MIYCLVARELALELHEPLREHFRDDIDIAVVVDARRGSRRRPGERRRSDAEPRSTERRRIRGPSGRRIADRRAPTHAVAAPSLPATAAPYAGRLVFVERLEPTDQEALDIETKRLVTRFQAGEQSVFEEIYRRHYEPVYAQARATLRDSHEAEDATQHVFERALGALAKFEFCAAPFRAWLATITRNIVWDSLRRSKPLLVEDPAELNARREAIGRPERLELDLSAREVGFELRRLPEAQREVIVFRYLLDLRYEEIAAVTDRSPKAARDLHYRAINALKRRLTAVDHPLVAASRS